MAATHKLDWKKWMVFEQLWLNKSKNMEYTPLYEKPWKKTKNALIETTVELSRAQNQPCLI